MNGDKSAYHSLSRTVPDSWVAGLVSNADMKKPSDSINQRCLDRTTTEIKKLRFSASPGVLALAVLLVCFADFRAFSQGQNVSEVPLLHARIDLTLDKKVYGRRETVKFRALLVNVDPRGFYVSKSFYEAGGGIAGFYVYGNQLTGKKGGIDCSALAGDAFQFSESRNPEQILKEDYLPLRPGGFVGYEGDYHPCTVNNPGEYQIWVEYVTGDLNQHAVRSLVINGQHVLDGRFKSKPVKFLVR